MAKILFTNSYFYRFDDKQWRTCQPYPPLGTIYAASLMRENGHEVALHDNNLVESEKSILPTFDQFAPKYLVIYDDGFNYLTKMCLTTMREAAFRMIAIAKERNCKVIVASSDSTDHYQAYLDAGADFIIHGEGEMTLLELVTSIEASTSVDQILGISFHKESKVQKNPPRPVLRNLDELPQAAWDLIDIEPYRKIWMDRHGYFALNMATTRGCPFKCNWCAKPIYGNRYNSRSPKRVVDEMEMLIQKFNVDYFWMCDDIFGLKPGWVQEFRDIVTERKLNFKYKIQSRVDLLLKEDSIQALADSGLHTAWVGAESGSQKILDAMDKQTSVEQIYEASKLLKSKGVRVAFFLQFGYLGETMEDIQKTLKMVLDIMPDEIGISVSYPLPGTKFYDKVKMDLKTKANWSDSDDLDMMFKNTYSKAFYKQLHRYVHNRYRIKRGMESIKNTFSNSTKTKSSTARDVASMIYNTPKAMINGVLLKKYEKQS